VVKQTVKHVAVVIILDLRLSIKERYLAW